MPIRFRCPTGHRLSVPESRAGKKVRCPRCKDVVQVPRASDAAAGETRRAVRKREPAEKPDRKPEKAPQSPTDARSASKPSQRQPPKLPVKPQPQMAILDEAPKEPAKECVTAKRLNWEDQIHPAPAVLDQPQDGNETSSNTTERPGDVESAPPPLAGDDAKKRPKVLSAGKVDRRRRPEPKPPPVQVPPPPPMAVLDNTPSAEQTPRSRREHRRDRRRARPGEGPSPWSAAPVPEELSRIPDRPLQARRQRLITAAVYQPDAGRIQTVRFLAMWLAAAVLFSALPALLQPHHLNVVAAPGWVRLVLMAAGLQAVYIVWTVTAPDWGSLWVSMIVFAAVSAGYGFATAVALATAPDQPLLLGMNDDVRRAAKLWCPAVMAVMALATYFCGRTSVRWRRAVELQPANGLR